MSAKYYLIAEKDIIDLPNEFMEIRSCDEQAEWAIMGKDIYDVAYSCYEHLQEMVDTETTIIERIPNEDYEKCNFLCSSGG